MPCCSRARDPAYLLARRLVSPGWALVVALLCVSVPWTVNAAFVMSRRPPARSSSGRVLACPSASPSAALDALAVVALARSSPGPSSSSSPQCCRSRPDP
jgi:hypothetical protein